MANYDNNCVQPMTITPQLKLMDLRSTEGVFTGICSIVRFALQLIIKSAGGPIAGKYPVHIRLESLFIYSGI